MKRLGDARARLQIANEPLTQYLGAIFMGRSYRRRRTSRARADRSSGAQIAPYSQPAVVALAQIEVISGRPDRRMALARGFAEGRRPAKGGGRLRMAALITPGCGGCASGHAMNVLAAAVLIGCTVAIALGQPTFRAGVDAVRVDVSVMNGSSRPGAESRTVRRHR